MITRLIKFSLENKLLILIAGIVLFVTGIISAGNTAVEVLPDFAPPQVIIQTHAPGLASEEVEAVITIPLESALLGTARAQTVRSSSFEGLSFITVIFDWGTNIFQARQLVTEKIQFVSSTFPESIKPPILSPIISPVGSVYFFALTTKTTSLMELRTYADWEIKNKLLAIPGVSKVLAYGGDIKQYQVLVNPAKLAAYMIGLNEVVKAAEEANVIVGGGYLIEDDKEFLIRGLGRITNIEDLKNSVITERNGIPIYLKNIANVKIGKAFKRSYGSVDGKEGVIVAVSKTPWANTLEVNEKIKDALNNLKKTLPKDIKITQTYSQSDFINTSVKNITTAILQGAFLAIIILLIFLANFRTSFISIVSIPLSLITAVLILKSFGLTINAMTLGGLAVAVGELVDDAIIDVENIFKRLRENKLSTNPKPAPEVIFKASCEIRNSVVYGTLILTVVLTPVLFLSGLAGQIFKPLAWSYITAILVSLLVALTLTPCLCSYLLTKPEDLPDKESTLITNIKEKYLILLDRVLKTPKKLFTVVIISSLAAIILFFSLGRSFLPELGEENLVVMAITPPGSSLNITQKVALGMEKILKKYPEIIRIGNRAGRSEADDEPLTSNISHFDITLKNGISQNTKDKLIEKIREDFEKLPGVFTLIRSFTTETMEHVISGQRAPIVIKLYGNDLETLRKYANKIQKILHKIKTLHEVQVEPIVDIPQIHIKIKREIAAKYGLKVGNLLRTIQIGFNGLSTSQNVIEGQRTFDLFVWFDKEYRNDLETIKNTLIDIPGGRKIPLAQLAEVKESYGPNIINREKASRRIVILANAKKGDISKSVEKAQTIILKNISLPEGYSLEFEGEYKQQKEANKKLFLITTLILLGIFLLLSLAFKSFKISLVVMINLPLALIGGVIATFLTSGVLSIASIIGFITLFGISTRNSILLVTRFFNIQKENPSLNIDDTIKQGSLDRLSPILMTATTTAFSMMPLALFPGAGMEIENPLAIVILGGIISSTMLTLFVIPVVYRKFVG